MIYEQKGNKLAHFHNTHYEQGHETAEKRAFIGLSTLYRVVRMVVEKVLSKFSVMFRRPVG